MQGKKKFDLCIQLRDTSLKKNGQKGQSFVKCNFFHLFLILGP